jgi:hypothetical protein
LIKPLPSTKFSQPKEKNKPNDDRFDSPSIAMTTIVVTAGVVNEEEEEEIRIPWAVIALSCESQDHFKGTINRGREFEASTKKIKHPYRYKKRNARNPAGLACATIKPSLPFLCFRERKLVSLTARSRSPPSRSHRQPNNPPPPSHSS